MADLESQKVISDEKTVEILRILMFGVTPAISLLGIIGNIFSIIILRKNRLEKSSNIILFALAINDIIFLIAFNNIPTFFYEIIDYTNGFSYSEEASYVLFILQILFLLLDNASGTVSLTLPVLITIERLTAVFLPLKFHHIFTPFRTWCMVAALQVLWYGIYIYEMTWQAYSYKYDPANNISVGVIEQSQHYLQNLEFAIAFDEAVIYLSLKFPPIITFVGCLAIGVKVKIASTHRKKLTMSNSKASSSNRTTRMLLAVCAVYIVACGLISLPSIVPNLGYRVSGFPTNLGKIVYQVINIAVCINSSCNFVVYVVMNKNFRDIYKSLFVGCWMLKGEKKDELTVNSKD